ncbi:MAG: AraC family transcriptional regulator [Ferruginibacter sp.]
MLLKDFIPAPDVQEFVQLYRIVHLVFEKGTAVPAKAYPPRPEQCLAFYPYDTETVVYERSGKEIKNIPIVLYGQFAEVTQRSIGNNFLVFQVIFNPGALYRLTGMPSSEITNQYMDAATVLPAAVKEVNEQLYHANNYSAMIAVADNFIRTLIKQSRKDQHPADLACKLMLKADNRMSLQQLASSSFISSKQLERKFKERTGVNPKLFERIIRFDKAFRLKNSKPGMDWLRIAMECNYHDYQHLAKEYKDFTGLGPNAFHDIENNAPERKLGLIEGYYS